MNHRRAFTTLELLVVIAILGLLAAFLLLGYSRIRSNSRDADRKSGASTYASAIETYGATHGNFFVEAAGNLCPPTSDAASRVSSYCGGANGFSYGRINFKGTVAEKQTFGGTTTTVGYNKTSSISDILQARGYLSTISFDPSSKKDQTIAGQADYILLRCNASSGSAQASAGSKNDGSAAVWIKLENTANIKDIDVSNTSVACGGAKWSGPFALGALGNNLDASWYAAPVGSSVPR